MKRVLASIISGLFLGGLAWLLTPQKPALSQSATPAVGRPAPDLTLGQQVYEQNCARCHGLTGAGDGPDAARMFPVPRNLADGVFKFRTTASGSPPTDEDLFHTLSQGLPGSRMPDFQRLPEEIRWQLVYYVKSLSTVFEEQQPEPIELGTDPGPQKANVARGKELYTELGCNACHGNFGRGDGPSAATLVDNWGNPIRAADLTQGWSHRGGSEPRQIVARIMTGIDGAPMPSYADALSSTEEAWDLAYYLHSIQEKPRWGRAIEAVKIEGALPQELEDPAWGKAEPTHLRLASIIYAQGKILPTTVTSVSVKAVYNEEEIAFLLSWNDPTASGPPIPDAVTLFFVPERKMRFAIGSLRSWPATAEAPPLETLRWAAEQEGGKAAYADGRWMALIRRPLKGEPPDSLALQPGVRQLIGIAVWDGSNAEQGRHRANSNWVDLVLRGHNKSIVSPE